MMSAPEVMWSARSASGAALAERVPHIGSIPCDCFVQVQEDASDGGPGGQFGGIQVLWRRSCADAQELRRSVFVLLILRQMLRGKLLQKVSLRRQGSTLQDLTIGVAQARRRVLAALPHDALGQGASGLDIRRIVEQDQGLLRSVRPRTLNGAFLARW